MVETELQVEMRRYIKLTEGWTGFKRYKILCAWMGMARMRDMNCFLEAQQRADNSEAETSPPLQPEDG
jgi:hypothetical protein